MATILLAWELGDGYSHANNVLRVGRRLAEHGHRVVCAFCNVVDSRPLFEKDPFRVLQAPYWNYRPRHNSPPFLASSLADVLAMRGWETVETLLALTESWQHLLDLVQPQLLVTDFSPTLCLAAYRTLPIVQVGAWFAMAPADADTFPLLVRGQAPTMPQEELLAVVQEVQRRRGRPIPPTLPSVLAEGDRFVLSLPELDPYHAQRKEPLWDPLEPLPAMSSDKPESSFFAYLGAEVPNVEAYLTQLALTGERGTVYLRNTSTDMNARLRLQGLTVLDRPARMGEMLAKSAVMVHHAGATTGNNAYAAGRPQILIPQHLEQATNAQILTRLGVGVSLLGNSAPEAAGRALEQILRDHRYADRAATAARRLHELPRRPTLPAIVACCLERLR